jgi:hypothetical protein
MEGELPFENKIRPPSKNSVSRFCRKVRLARGNICENCGATPSKCQIESHHILEYNDYPNLGKDEDNIIVLCQACHRGLSRPHGDYGGDRMMCLAQLEPELRERIASYVERKAPRLTTFVRIVRAGGQAARDYFFRRLEM